METTTLFTDLSAEEAETVNGAHYYYYQFVGYTPVYELRYGHRRRRCHRRRYYGHCYRPRYYSCRRSYYSYN
ncbi:hypothetical protein [Microseira wollei]|uniref:Uncharacterized protein n=1 Tax=Microseira wollei NIES-4236 TaxID=2530354 RepID=A0AAV3XCV2_9CYAN|nr:hypothetical protein [Microseira wollei]GET40358.1 hypothetical protein MiSe_51670 [Microseira wollei NIES-4236]